MATPNPAPTDSQPAGQQPTPATNQDAAQQGSPAGGSTPRTTQSELAQSDGAGIRGDYGDAEQTNGLEGGEQSPTDAGPDRADQNPTNAAHEGAV